MHLGLLFPFAVQHILYGPESIHIDYWLMLCLYFKRWVLAKRRNLNSSNIKFVPQHFIETRLGDLGKKLPFDKDRSLDAFGNWREHFLDDRGHFWVNGNVMVCSGFLVGLDVLVSTGSLPAPFSTH